MIEVFAELIEQECDRLAIVPHIVEITSEPAGPNGAQTCIDRLTGDTLDVAFPVRYKVGTKVSFFSQNGQIHVFFAGG